jgi:drug/metabolite transporter (DMT)-like permease
MLAIGLAAVSCASIFIRFARSEGVPALAIAALRLLLSTAVLVPVAVWRTQTALRAVSGRVWLLAGVSGVCLGLHFASWISSLDYTTITSSTVFVTTSPLFVAGLAAIFLREPISRATWVGLALAIAGSLVIALGDVCGASSAACASAFAEGGNRALIGNGLATLGALAVAAYLIVGRRLRATLDLLPYITLTYGAAGLTLLSAALITQTPLLGHSWAGYGWVLLLALIPQLLGHTSFNWALKQLPVTYVSVVTLGEPIGSTLLALAFLGEFPGVWTLAGAAVILFGIGWAARTPSNQTTPA